MTISYVDSSSVDLNGSTETISIPAARQTGDLIVVFQLTTTSIVSSISSGYTLVYSENFGDSSFRVYQKISDGSETNFEITWTATETGVGGSVVFRGDFGQNPIPQYSSKLLTSTTSMETTALNNISADNAVILVSLVEDDSIISFNPAPSGYSTAIAFNYYPAGTYRTMAVYYDLSPNATENPIDSSLGATASYACGFLCEIGIGRNQGMFLGFSF